jgi:phosphoribosylaminoimidazolecarboxamide formyltransferase/IMP cyclohydrolase
VVTGKLTPAMRRDLLLGIATVKFTQSNTIAYVRDGHVIGIGAGHQSRIDCTRLAGEKATNWRLLQHPHVLASRAGAGEGAQVRINELYRVAAELGEAERAEWLKEFLGLALVSDGHIPFDDNVLEAHARGVSAIASPPGSIRDDAVADACRKLDITLVHTAHRYFHH